QLVSQSEYSIGPIEGDELICRGAFDPSGGDQTTGKVTKGLIDKHALASGQLSTYRARGRTDWDLHDVATHVQANDRRVLFKVVGVPASDLRSVQVDNVFICVVDETECDRQGNHHKLHAHVTTCRDHPLMQVGTPLFDKLLLGVWTCYRTALPQNVH